MSSMKKRMKIVMRAMPSAQSYSVIGPVRHSLVRPSAAGARRWIKAVAMITPDPKYFAAKKHFAISLLLIPRRRVQVGKAAPMSDPTRMTKIEEMRTPMLPLKSLPSLQWPGLPARGTTMVALSLPGPATDTCRAKCCARVTA